MLNSSPRIWRRKRTVNGLGRRCAQLSGINCEKGKPMSRDDEKEWKEKDRYLAITWLPCTDENVPTTVL